MPFLICDLCKVRKNRAGKGFIEGSIVQCLMVSAISHIPRSVADSLESTTLSIYCTLILLIHNHASSGRSHLAWRQTVSHARAAWRSPWLGCAASRQLRSGCPRWAVAWIRQRRGSLLPYHIGSRCRSCTRRPAGQWRAAGFRQPAAHR